MWFYLNFQRLWTSSALPVHANGYENLERTLSYIYTAISTLIYRKFMNWKIFIYFTNLLLPINGISFSSVSAICIFVSKSRLYSCYFYSCPCISFFLSRFSNFYHDLSNTNRLIRSKTMTIRFNQVLIELICKMSNFFTRNSDKFYINSSMYVIKIADLFLKLMNLKYTSNK